MIEIDVVENSILYETNVLDNDLRFKINNPKGINVRFECSLDGLNWVSFSVISLNEWIDDKLIPKIVSLNGYDTIMFEKDDLEVVNRIRIRTN